MLFRTPLIAVLAMASTVFLPNARAADSLDTDIVFTNSTLDTLQVSYSGDAVFQPAVSSVAPLATETLGSITRVDGESAGLSVTLRSGDYQIELIQQTENTQLAFGIKAGELTIPPQLNSEIQRFDTTLAGDKNQLAFNAENLSEGGKLTYVLHEYDKRPAIGAANHFNLLSYNIWATTVFGSEEVSTRLDEMPELMSGYDAMVLTEVFDLIPGKTLTDRLRQEYPYQSDEIYKPGKLLGSGMRILSRWPFEEQKNLKYTACYGIQCAATRGVLYARINKQGNRYHVFVTHVQSSMEENREARMEQLQEMGDFIASLNIPDDEPVIMAGDFNTDKINLQEDYDYMVSVLRATEADNIGHDVTYDSSTNYWAAHSHEQYIDYTFIGADNLQPTQGYQEAFAPRHTKDELWGIWDLSDHYAVRGLFNYPTEAQPERPVFPFFGDVVHLKTENGHYMRAMNGGGSFISAGSDQVGTWESFFIQPAGGNKVTIQDREGNYVSLDSYVLGTLKAKSKLTKRGHFEMVDLGDGKIALKAYNRKYLRADFGGGAGLSASSRSIKAHQTFELIRP